MLQQTAELCRMIQGETKATCALSRDMRAMSIQNVFTAEKRVEVLYGTVLGRICKAQQSVDIRNLSVLQNE